METVKNDAVEGNVRPKREQFKFNIVIGNNGSRIDEAQVAKHITATEPKLRRKQMKEAGWTSIKLFDKDAYMASFQNYRADRKSAESATKVSTIGEAFKSADVKGTNKRVERALNILLPLYTGINETKVTDAFKKIIRTVAGSTPNYATEKPKTRPAAMSH